MFRPSKVFILTYINILILTYINNLHYWGSFRDIYPVNNDILPLILPLQYPLPYKVVTYRVNAMLEA